MTAQGAARDRCSIVRASLTSHAQDWCIAHDLPAGHAAPQEGDVHNDPADRPSASDLATPDGEEQYAGGIRGASRVATSRDARVREAVALMRDPEASPGQVHAAVTTLARLRAQSWAASQTWRPVPTLHPMAATCATCGQSVVRTAEIGADLFLAVSPWRHLNPTQRGHDVVHVVFSEESR